METEPDQRTSTGVPGLDEITHGGLPRNRWYLMRGRPGSGKTTAGLHFLSAGERAGERGLFLSLEKPVEQIRHDARKQRIDIEDVRFVDLAPGEEFFAGDRAYDLFSPAEVERGPITEGIVDAVESVRPDRIFADSLTMFRFLVADPFLFRREVLSFVRFLLDRDMTVLASSEISDVIPDDDLQFLASGVITLHLSTTARRTLRTASVDKLLGSSFRAGEHGMALTDQGMRIFPRLLPELHVRELVPETLHSGIDELDALLHGGIERGTVTLIAGPSGVGKTTIGATFVRQAARHGERSVIYTFDEEPEMLIARSAGVGIPFREMIQAGNLSIVRVHPVQVTADEFAAWVREEVEERDARVVMVDGTPGYRLTLLGEDLLAQLYVLSDYFRNIGVTALLTSEVERITGDFRVTEAGISHLADNVIFLRYLEMRGQLRKAIGVLKKRMSDFERTLRELEITSSGVRIGAPLTQLRGILLGTPEWVGPPTGERGPTTQEEQ